MDNTNSNKKVHLAFRSYKGGVPIAFCARRTVTGRDRVLTESPEPVTCTRCLAKMRRGGIGRTSDQWPWVLSRPVVAQGDK